MNLVEVRRVHVDTAPLAPFVPAEWDVHFPSREALLAGYFQERDSSGLVVTTGFGAAVGTNVTLRVSLGSVESAPVRLRSTVRWHRALNTPPRYTLGLVCWPQDLPLLRRLLALAPCMPPLNREHDRVEAPVAAEVTGSSGVAVEATLLDLSEGTVHVRLPPGHPPGSVVRVLLKPPFPSPRLALRALVIWRSGQGSVTGMTFLHDHDSQRAALRQLIGVIRMRQLASRWRADGGGSP